MYFLWLRPSLVAALKMLPAWSSLYANTKSFREEIPFEELESGPHAVNRVVLKEACAGRTDRPVTDSSLIKDLGVVSVCLFLFRGVERDKSGCESKGCRVVSCRLLAFV